jgi:HD-like signal output (HDOD) protein
MAQAPFDVVVADMRMPVMTGADLLNQVMRLYPRTVRLILSGHADSNLVLKCVGSTHQYLSKPCDREMLKATVERAAALEQSLQSETLRKLASQMERLPSLPSLYGEIVEKVKSPDVLLGDVAAIVTKDIGMTAKLLKLVNSAFFGLGRQISDPEEAVAYLGIDTLKSLVLTIHTFDQFDGARVPGFSCEALWQHSAETAQAAKAIAQAEEANPKLVDEAFSAGLLHDSGKLVLAGNFGTQYRDALHLAATDSCSLLEAERRVFGATHAEVGGYLLGLWGLPVPVVEAITLHHDPAQCLNRALSPLLAVHVGDALSHEVAAPASGRLSEPPPDQAYLTQMGLVHRLDPWRSCVRAALTQNETV